MIPRKGAIVAEITEKNLIDVLEVRRVLEQLAAELAAERINEEGIASLEKAASEFEKQLKMGSVNEIARADEAFHLIIHESAGNQKLLLLLKNFREQMYRYRVEYLKQTDQYDKLTEEHRTIYERIEAHDQQGAAHAMFTHIDRQQQIMLATVRKGRGNTPGA